MLNTLFFPHDSFQYLYAGLLSLLIAIPILVLAVKFGFFKVPVQTIAPLFVTFREVIAVFFVFLSTQLLLFPLLVLSFLYLMYGRYVTPKELKFTAFEQGLMNLLAAFLACLAILFYVWKTKPELICLKMTRKQIKSFFLGIMSWCISYPLMLGLSQLSAFLLSLKYPHFEIDQVAVKQLKMIMEYPFLFWITVFYIVILVPWVEELIFRGLLQSWLVRKLGGWLGIFFSSFIFAFFHFAASQGVFNVSLIFSLFILACFLGFLYKRQHSLWASYGLHLFFNAVSVIMIILFSNGQTNP